jgi:glycine cleavage system regulatory protein
MMVVTAEDGNVEKLHADLAALVAETSMACSLLPATPVSDTPPVRGTPYRLLSRGKDQAGVVPRLSHLLRVMSVNIEKLRIDTPRDAKEPCFELNLLLSVPRETPISALREYLAHLCGEIGITCDLSPA